TCSSSIEISSAAELEEEDAREGGDREVACEQVPGPGRGVIERQRPVVPREPRLRQAEREEEKRAGRDSAYAAHEEHERDEPHEVLRRENLVEGDERAECRRGREQRRFTVRAAPPREDDPDRDDRCDLERGREIGRETRAPPAQRLGP